VPRPGVHQLLIQSALDAGTLRRLRDNPGEVFSEYELSPEEQDILRNPDPRLLALLGRAVRESATSGDTEPAADVPAPQLTPEPAGAPIILPNTLAPTLLALTVVPCVAEDGTLRYAVWVNPMAEGTLPATLPLPPAATLPGVPLAPLYAIIELDGLHAPHPDGSSQVALWAHFRQSTNAAVAHASADENCATGAAPEAIAAAAAAVRTAPPAERYGKLAALLQHVKENG
jgi:hypothetical protein